MTARHRLEDRVSSVKVSAKAGQLHTEAYVWALLSTGSWTQAGSPAQDSKLLLLVMILDDCS